MRFALALALAAGVASSASAQLIVGNDQTGTTSLYHIDVGTGAATPILTTATNETKPWGMAYDPATNTLWWNNGGTLFSAPFNIAGLTVTNHGAMTFNAASINFVALGWYNGQLVGTRNIATEAVYAIDTTTLQCTQLYVHPSTYDFGGLDADVTTGKLYGLTDAAPAPQVRGLYEISVTGMTQTFIAGYPGTETDIDGLAVHNGLAYYVTDGPNTTQASFYVYDIATGTQIGTLPSPFTGSGTFCAAAFIAPAGPPACYANCDGSTITPILNVNDFICFNNLFAANDPLANCDGSTTPPTLNVNDFVCFLNVFGAGCS
ncbi:MAG: hypothetical protein JNM80_09470 [Phycisphaerae bacterium]|nr:hypothetical protein [Phycisphaerae bacterium]